ncbi:MAG TPA: accessory factor UbiK family protein [Polymorphobacter sp.]|jgi:BMFP domain-containing protein YqiC|nr:accessory factor UbiK family protein [Polymorphobacter sp.]
MQSQNKIFEDLSKVATSALGTIAGLGREVETMAKNRVREMSGAADMVTRDEFEAVKAMAANARAEVELLKAEIAAMKSAAAPTRKTAKA